MKYEEKGFIKSSLKRRVVSHQGGLSTGIPPHLPLLPTSVPQQLSLYHYPLSFHTLPEQNIFSVNNTVKPWTKNPLNDWSYKHWKRWYHTSVFLFMLLFVCFLLFIFSFLFLVLYMYRTLQKMAFPTTPSPSGDTWDKMIKAKNKKHKINNQQHKQDNSGQS